MPKNTFMNHAKQNKKDEFYTQYSDVENEVKHYDFKNKIVYCNCDNSDSNFVKYFKQNKDKLGIKKLIYSGYVNGYGTSFDSPESLELLKQADVVVTNPPFSLFRHFLDILLDYNKQFLIIGHINTISCKDVFSAFKDKRFWLGYGFKGNTAHFYSPYEDTATAIDHKKGMIRVSGVCWYTNLPCENKPMLKLTKTYDPLLYPKYDDYDAIDVNKTADIPIDYDGVMGVPITFLHKYNPNQFSIIGLDRCVNNGHCFHLHKKELYHRILIVPVHDFI